MIYHKVQINNTVFEIIGRNRLKQENCNGENNYLDDALNDSETEFEVETNRIQCTEADEKHMTVMEKMVKCIFIFLLFYSTLF